MTAAQFLIDTSAVARLMRPGAESFGWDQAAAAGLLAVCPVTELEFFSSARSAADRERGIAGFRSLFGWVPVHHRAFARAWDVQGELTSKSQHRSAGPVDLVVAATAELHGLTLLHHDRDFGVIARVARSVVRTWAMMVSCRPKCRFSMACWSA